MALLISAGVFLRASVSAASSDPGFPLEGGVLAELDPSLIGLDQAQGRRAYTAVLDRVRSLSGIEAASVASIVPFGEVRDGRQVQYGDDSVFALFNVVGAGYFSTLRLPVVAGREFTAIRRTGCRVRARRDCGSRTGQAAVRGNERDWSVDQAVRIRSARRAREDRRRCRRRSR